MRLWLVAALLIACSSTSEPNPTRHYHVQLSAAFTTEQATAIMSAVNVWETRSNSFVTFDGDTSSQSDIIVFELATQQALNREFGVGAIGLTSYAGQSSRIDILTGLDASTFTQTVEHEVGHALGLQHTIAGTVMCANTGCAALSVTCADVARVEEGVTLSCNDLTE